MRSATTMHSDHHCKRWLSPGRIATLAGASLARPGEQVVLLALLHPERVAWLAHPGVGAIELRTEWYAPRPAPSSHLHRSQVGIRCSAELSAIGGHEEFSPPLEGTGDVQGFQSP